MNQFISTAQAAKLIDRSVQTTCRLLRDGELSGRKLNSGRTSNWIVDKESIEPYLEKRQRELDNLTTGQVAQRLGCSRSTANKMAARNAFPNAYKEGRYWRIPKGDLDRWMKKSE